MGTSEEDPGEPGSRRRRRILAGAGLLGVLGIGGVAGYRRLLDHPEPSNELVSTIPDDELRELAHRYAPDLHFDRREQWFPTDPSRYATDRDEGTIVNGFEALRAYTREYHELGRPPSPIVYWHAHDATANVFAIQYWQYLVFDQFTVNFHWHDWELVQVFIDAETRRPVLVSASAHSRSSPNNEYVEPDFGEDRRPIILAELGSHSSATDLNEAVPSFERLPDRTGRSDITNDVISITDRLDTPFAYGLPRDEGAHLPVVMPELDDVPLYEHHRLADVVGREDFLDGDVTVRHWRELARPPSELPEREVGLVMTHPDSQTASEVTYALREIQEVDGIDDFTGRQLSFEFPIPQFAEDTYAGHITDVGIPWEQPRFTDPLSDVTDFQHRLAVQGIGVEELLDRVVGQFTILSSGSDGAVEDLTEAELEELGALVPVSRKPVPIELAVRLASPDPRMVVTNDGVFGFTRVDAGEHLLGAVGPGIAPVAVRFTHDGGTVTPGADGTLTVVANADATWIRGDGQEIAPIERVRVIEDFAGPAYRGRPVEGDGFAVAVHRDGRYIVEVTDRQGVTGARRVVPGDRDEVILGGLETGKQSLIQALAGYLASTVSFGVELCAGCEVLETFVGPRDADFKDPDRIRGAPRRTTVALRDRLALRLETGGLPRVGPEEAIDGISVDFELLQGRGVPTSFDASDPGVDLLAGDTGIYITLNMAASEVAFEPGQTWDASVSMPGDDVIAPRRFTIAERTVELSMDEPPYRVSPVEESIIAGASTMAPGTVLTVRVRMEEAFQSREVALDEAGRFGAVFDFGERGLEERFEIEVWEGDRRHVRALGVVAPEPSVDGYEPARSDSESGWEIIRRLAEATEVAEHAASDRHAGSARNETLGDVRGVLDQALDRLTRPEPTAFGETGAKVLARRVEEGISRVDRAMETPL